MTELAVHKRQLALLQTAVVIAVLGGFMMLFMQKMRAVEAHVEQAMLTLMVQDIQARLMMYKTERIANGTFAEMAALADSNPIESFIDPPPGYVGALTAIDWSAVRPGQWFFDTTRGQLVYRVMNEHAFVTDFVNPKHARFRLDVRYEDRNGNARFDRGTDRFFGLSFMPVRTYGWQF